MPFQRLLGGDVGRRHDHSGFAQAEWARSGTLATGNIEISKPGVLPAPITSIFGTITPGKFTSRHVGATDIPGAIAF